MLSHLPTVAALALALAIPAEAAPITYQITPRAGESPDWSIVGGKITTDGTLGEILPENFLSWELSFSSPSGVSVLSSENGHTASLSAYRVFFNDPGLPPTSTSFVATKEGLLIIPGAQSLLELTFSSHPASPNSIPSQFVTFYAPLKQSAVGGYLVDNAIDPFQPIEPRGFDSLNPNQSRFFSSPGPFVVALAETVPEPAAMLILAICSLSFGLFRTAARLN